MRAFEGRVPFNLNMPSAKCGICRICRICRCARKKRSRTCKENMQSISTNHKSGANAQHSLMTAPSPPTSAPLQETRPVLISTSCLYSSFICRFFVLPPLTCFLYSPLCPAFCALLCSLLLPSPGALRPFRGRLNCLQARRALPSAGFRAGFVRTRRN